MAYSISTALAIYFVLWWVVLFVTLPFGVRSQHEDGEGAPGTDPGAPVMARMGYKLLWTTLISAVVFGIGALLFLLVGRFAPASFLAHFTVFILACFVGYMVVWNVTPALHTPLMSVTNAVSSIIAIGALVQIAPDLTKISADLSRPNEWIRWLAVGGIGLATINMFGGFAVTRRMLEMFRK